MSIVISITIHVTVHAYDKKVYGQGGYGDHFHPLEGIRWANPPHPPSHAIRRVDVTPQGYSSCYKLLVENVYN